MSAHYHDFHEMIIILAGHQAAEVEGRVYHAQAGDALLYRAGVVHAEWSDGPLHTAFLNFRCDSLPGDSPVHVVDRSGRLRWCAQWLLELRSEPGSEPAARPVFQSLLGQWQASWTDPGPPLVRTLRQFMQDHLAEALTLADLAEIAAMSRFHLVRVYRRCTGLTPMADLRRLRLEAAERLILSTDLPLKAIAPRVGLRDVYHFARTFSRARGFPPSQLRRRAT